jgi:hypothetical protein
MVASGVYDVVLGSRIPGWNRAGGRHAGMEVRLQPASYRGARTSPLGSKLSEFHTGFRAYSREALLRLPLRANSDDFVFDNQLLAQAVAARLRIGEISCPTSYHSDASSINFSRSVRYGLGVLATSAAFLAWRMGLATPRIFKDRAEDHLEAKAG